MRYVSEQRVHSPAEDWHLLLAGLSYGFLILASARGLLNQEAKQRQTYFRHRRKLFDYEDLVAALNIASRIDIPGETARVNAVVDKITRRLTESPRTDECTQNKDVHFTIRSRSCPPRCFHARSNCPASVASPGTTGCPSSRGADEGREFTRRWSVRVGWSICVEPKAKRPAGGMFDVHPNQGSG